MAEKVPHCRSCDKPLTYCPMCHGEDPTDYAHQGQGDDGYWVCQTEGCEDYINTVVAADQLQQCK